MFFNPYPDKNTKSAQPIPIHMRKGGNFMDTIALILSIIGCLNWGLVGIFRFDLVAWLFGGAGSLFRRLVYTIVGLAGLWCISFLFRRKSVIEGE